MPFLVEILQCLIQIVTHFNITVFATVAVIKVTASTVNASSAEVVSTYCEPATAWVQRSSCIIFALGTVMISIAAVVTDPYTFIINPCMSTGFIYPVALRTCLIRIIAALTQP